MLFRLPERGGRALVIRRDSGWDGWQFPGLSHIDETQRIGQLMRSAKLTVRIDARLKKRLGRLAKTMGRSGSSLAAEAIVEWIGVKEWQVAGIKRAIASLDRGEGVPHEVVKNWVLS
jgi:RHH-type transcriptional regulator, rel operon repressor / antitoxin RelB